MNGFAILSIKSKVHATRGVSMGLYEKVLVVDDAPEVIMLMRRVLERESVETVSATNGIEALQALKE